MRNPPLPIGFPKASPVIHAEARITGLTSGRTADRGGKDSYACRTGACLIGRMFTQNFMGFRCNMIIVQLLYNLCITFTLTPARDFPTKMIYRLIQLSCHFVSIFRQNLFPFRFRHFCQNFLKLFYNRTQLSP